MLNKKIILNVFFSFFVCFIFLQQSYSYETEIYENIESIQIKDLILSPNKDIERGDRIIAKILIENKVKYPYGNIIVQLRIFELDIRRSTDIKNLYPESTLESGNIIFEIPDDAYKKNYEIEISILSSNGDILTIKKYPLNLISKNVDEKTKNILISYEKNFNFSPNLQIPIYIKNKANENLILNLKIFDDKKIINSYSNKPSVLLLKNNKEGILNLNLNLNKKNYGKKILNFEIYNEDELLKKGNININFKNINEANSSNFLLYFFILFFIILIIGVIFFIKNKDNKREIEIFNKEDYY